MDRSIGSPEDWGVRWILMYGFCMVGFAVFIIGFIGVAKEVAIALQSAGGAEKQTVVVSSSTGSSTGSSSTTTSTNQQQDVVDQKDAGSGGRSVSASAVGDVGVSLDGPQNGGGGGNAGASAPRGVPAAASAAGSCGAPEVDTANRPPGLQPPGANIGQSSHAAGGQNDGVGAVAAESGLVKAGNNAEEDKRRVQKIFESVDNLPELLGIEKGAEENMTSEELWRIASEATRKRLQTLSRDLEASRIKVDRQIRDEKRRKPGKRGAYAAAAGRAGGGGGGAHQQSGKSRRRAGNGSRNPRSGGVGGEVVAEAAAVAEAIAKTERVKALHVDSRALQSLHQSLDDMLNEWDVLPLGGTLVGGSESRPEPKAASASANSSSESTRLKAPSPPPPPPLAPSSIDLSLKAPAAAATAASGVVGSSKPAVVAGAGASASEVAASSGAGGAGGGGGGSAAVQGGAGTQVTGLAASSPSSTTDGDSGRKKRGGAGNNKKSSAGSTGGQRVSSEGGGSSTSTSSSTTAAAATATTTSRRKRGCNGRSGGGGHVNPGVPSRSTPHNHPENTTTTTTTNNNRSNAGPSPAYAGASCFPPSVPRAAGAGGVVQEARAFAPAQHLAVLQALLNGDEEQGDRGFQSDSDSEREEAGALGNAGVGGSVVGAGPGAGRGAGRGSARFEGRSWDLLSDLTVAEHCAWVGGDRRPSDFVHRFAIEKG
eukprot:g12992.t1